LKKKEEQKRKLSIKKFQISKIKNPKAIIGGIIGDNDECQGGDSGGMGTQRVQ
jgi:hypothetical protein